MPLVFSEINREDVGYPKILGEIKNPPRKLYVRGALPDPNLPLVAIVGTRKATKQGLELAENTARELACAGVVVVSGLAMGIDTAAHKGALDGSGYTVAVLGNGIDTVYPAQNERLARKIESHGAIISEYGPGEPSFKGNFIERNRIISGLSLGTVVIEVPERSGALTTARFAGEEGRSVFVFPGPVANSNYVGSHALIRDGATLITNVSEILEDLDIKQTAPESRVNLDESGANERTVMETLRDAGGPLNVDRIIEHTKLDPQVVGQVLATLTIWRIVQETESGYELSNR